MLQIKNVFDEIMLKFKAYSGAKVCRYCTSQESYKMSTTVFTNYLQQSASIQPRTSFPRFLNNQRIGGEGVLNGSVRGHVRTNEELLHRPPPFRLFHSAPPRIEALQKFLKFRYLPNFVLKFEFNIWLSFRNYKC